MKQVILLINFHFIIFLINYLECNEKIGVSSEFLAKELSLSSNEIKQKMAFWVLILTKISD